MKFFAFAISTIFAIPITTNGLIQYADKDNNPFGSFGFIGQNGAVVRVSAKRIFTAATVRHGGDYPFSKAKLMLDRLKTK